MIRLGFALCGSFCTLKDAISAMRGLKELGYDITPIMSEITYATDTRFGDAKSFVSEIETICAKPVIHSITEAEPIGPRASLDILLIAPCTGNTLGKLAGGITDTAVTMAAKAHLRNSRPLVIAVSTNDGLMASAENIGKLQARKNIYFVPYGQDNPLEKSTSLVAKFDKTAETVASAINGRQLQPVLA